MNEEALIGGGRFEGLSHDEIVQCLTPDEKRRVGNMDCGDGSHDQSVEFMAGVAVDLFGVQVTPEVE